MRAVVTTEPVQKLPQLPTLPKHHTIFFKKNHGTYRTTTEVYCLWAFFTKEIDSNPQKMTPGLGPQKLRNPQKGQY